MQYTRLLKLMKPLLNGEDVKQVQRKLQQLDARIVGSVDGVFGRRTKTAVMWFQEQSGLPSDGIVGPATWQALFAEQEQQQTSKLTELMPDLIVDHNYKNSITWRLDETGIVIENNIPERTRGQPVTVSRIWEQFGDDISRWSVHFGVPAESLIATIATESGGKADAVREEPGYVSDDITPNKVSPGLMQTLISTASSALHNNDIDRQWLLVPAHSIQAGTAYIASQWEMTQYDPPKIACAYNAGAIYHNNNETNRWKMRQYPMGTGEHTDRFVKWFNDCMFVFDREHVAPPCSYALELSTMRAKILQDMET